MGTRRSFLKKSAGTLALAPVAITTASNAYGKERPDWPLEESNSTPKLCMYLSLNADEQDIRRVKQLGVRHVLSGAGKIPWDAEDLVRRVRKLEQAGIRVINLMISGFPNVIYGRPGRDQEIDWVRQSLDAAGKAGVPVVEYNFYAHRLMDGYYEVAGRGGAGYTGFDYDPVRNLPPDPEHGIHRSNDLWKNLEYFLKAVIPTAEKAGVRMALHPNDPPIPVSHGSDQIMRNFDDWKRLIDLVDSPANGMTYDCGVTRETGADPVEVCRYLGSRDRINHVHYRNVLVEKPFEKYVEVFPDNGQVDMWAVMRELFRQGYTRGIYPEHQRALDYDREVGMSPYYPGGGGYAGLTYNIAYARAMMQAVMASEA